MTKSPGFDYRAVVIDIINAVLDYMEHHGISKKAFAAACGLSLQRFSNLLRLSEGLSLKTICILLKGMKMNHNSIADWIRTETKKQPPLNKKGAAKQKRGKKEKKKG